MKRGISKLETSPPPQLAPPRAADGPVDSAQGEVKREGKLRTALREHAKWCFSWAR